MTILLTLVTCSPNDTPHTSTSFHTDVDSKTTTKTLTEISKVLKTDNLQYTNTGVGEETVELNLEVALQYAIFSFHSRLRVP